MAEKIVAMYNTGKFTRNEIANLLNISVPSVALKIKGRKLPDVKYGTGGGYYLNYKKYTDSQEAEIAKDYYELGLKVRDIMQKWGAHPMQIQRIRNIYGQQYGQKKRGKPRLIKYDAR